MAKGETSIVLRRSAEARRQAVLDWLHANPSSRMSAIMAALPEHDHKSLVGTVTRMRMAGEISAAGKLREYRYTAVASITATAESMIATNNASSINPGARATASTTPPRAKTKPSERQQRLPNDQQARSRRKPLGAPSVSAAPSPHPATTSTPPANTSPTVDRAPCATTYTSAARIIEDKIMSIIHHEGNITYVNAPSHGIPERRTDVLTDLRVVIDAALELQRVTKKSWPLDYPVPPDVDRINKFVDYAIARARGGALKNFGEMAND